MTVVNPKSISGINSITTGSGSDNLLTIHTSDASSTERVRINSSGDVIVGSGITVSPDGDIFATGVTTSTTFVGALTGNVTGNISGGTVAGSTGTFSGAVSGTTGTFSSAVSGTTGTFTGDVDIADTIVHTGDTNTKIRFPTTDTISFETSGSEGARLDAGRRFLIGSTTARTSGGSAYAHLQVEGTDSPGSEILVIRNSNDTYASTLGLVKTRGTSDGAVTTVADNDKLGQIQFRGADGSDIYSVAASIHGEVDGSPSDGTDMPGALVFGTTADGSASPTERVRISSGGNFGINQTNPQYLLHVTGTTSAARIACNDSASGISALAVTNESNADLETTIFTNRSSLGSSVNIPISFHTNGKTNEKIRMHTTGELSVPSGVTLGLTAADKTASNTLDDYEEGSFSPGFSGDSSSGSYGYSRQAGRYTKIGNVVYYQLYVTTNAVSANATGNTLVTGLPFTSTGGNDYPGSCIGYYNGWNGIVPSQALLDISNTRIYIYKNNNGSSVTHSVPTDVQIGTSIILTGHYYTAS